MFRPIILVTATSLMAACVAPETINTPNPATVSARQVDQAFADSARAGDLPLTPAGEVPTGTITYDGQIGATVEGDALGSVLADLTLTVGFARNRISGNVSNINLIDQEGTPTQRFGGSLEISGFENRGDLDAGASGEITAVDNQGKLLEADLNMDLAGEVRSDRTRGDTVYGSTTGTARGEFDLDLDGVFYGERR